ncbi:hypothetical protein P170DRAFT_37093 [Aspergillus steynii IBT 23096]|uniref:Uncharacterized protein n=1 Tax=Aspergillus steynii IBT 23096 TaxID=1392250 RepID=A0A2I2GQY2_9EURO|nr:uncharacterized protein P170DRAFT_37093 [Aspergillus steynii IBT 23096]PLB55286.1 hypothetical protein P170DRAFT_37093 [Aspergillus steynii IBT 23096]
MMPFMRMWSRFSSSPAPESTPVNNEPISTYTRGTESVAIDCKHPHFPVPRKEESRALQAQIEPASSSSAQEPASFWKDINPPAGHKYTPAVLAHSSDKSSLPSSSPPPVQPRNKDAMDRTKPTSTRNSALPGYNDVSGAVIVDWNGLPHFLSPQEELERKSRLERAVRERMLGLSRRTDFAWESPCHGTTLPQYSPAKAKRSQRPSHRSDHYG